MVNYLTVLVIVLATVAISVHGAKVHECVPLNTCAGSETNVTALIFGDFEGGDKISGKLYVGGNAVLNNAFVGESFEDSQGGSDHVVVGNDILVGSGKLGKGNIIYGGRAQIDGLITSGMGYNGILRQPDRFDFISAQSCYEKTCRHLSNHDATTKDFTVNGDTMLMSGTNKGTEIFEVSCSDLAQSKNVVIKSRTDANIMVRVVGANKCELKDLSVKAEVPALVLWNFCSFDELSFQDVSLQGSLFAPSSKVVTNNTDFSGDVVAASWKGKAKLGEASFRGCLGLGHIQETQIPSKPNDSTSVVAEKEEINFFQSSSHTQEKNLPKRGRTANILRRASRKSKRHQKVNMFSPGQELASEGDLFLEVSTGNLFLETGKSSTLQKSKM